MIRTVVDENVPRLSAWAIDHPRAALGLALLTLVWTLPGLLRLELRLDGRSLVPPKATAVADDERMRQTFQLEDQVVVFVESLRPEGILRPETLARIRRLTVEIYRIPELERRHITSLASEGRDRIDSLDYSPFLYPLPETPAELASLEADIRAAPILFGTLVAADFSGSAILVQIPEGVGRWQLYRRIAAIVEAIDSGDDRIHIVGAPAAETLLGRHLVADLMRILPLCVLVMAALLYWFFRRAWVLAVVFGEVVAGLVFTFGLMGWLGQPIYLTTAVLPVVVTTLGLTDEIHLLSSAQRWIRRNSVLFPTGGEEASQSRALVRHVLATNWRPIFATSMTTAAGFLSFLVSGLPPVGAFGTWAAVGVLFCFAWSCFVTPAALRLLGVRRLAPPELRWYATGQSRAGERGEGDARKPEWVVRIIAALGQPGARVLLVLSVLVLVLGIPRIRVQDGWVSGFAETSSFRRSVERVDRSLAGTHLLQLHLRFDRVADPGQSPAGGDSAAAGGDPLPFHDHRVLSAVGRFEEAIRAEPGVGGVLGPHSHLSTTEYLASGRIEGSRSLPESAASLRSLWRRLELGRGPHRRREIVTEDRSEGLVTVFLPSADYRRTARLMERIEELESEILSSYGGRLAFAGDVALAQAMIGAIVSGQLRSIALALSSGLLILWLLSKRLRLAFLAILPVTIACAAVLGAMGWTGMPLGVATSMFVVITLGVGIDFPVHLLARATWNRDRGHPRPMTEARWQVGPAIVVDSLVVTLGFGLLVFSEVPANSRLGGLLALSIVSACACALVLFRPEGEPSPGPARSRGPLEWALAVRKSSSQSSAGREKGSERAE